MKNTVGGNQHEAIQTISHKGSTAYLKAIRNQAHRDLGSYNEPSFQLEDLVVRSRVLSPKPLVPLPSMVSVYRRTYIPFPYIRKSLRPI